MYDEKQGGSARRRLAGGLDRGAIVGRYLIVGLLGRGGMGEVYAAYDPELDRKIALKLLRASSSAGVDASEGRARLLREAQAIARLSDPNVVTVFDVGTFDDRVFLAMEFVDGTTLGYWLHAKPRSWPEVVKTFMGAGRGLAAAHRAGVVHRDFKPDNVMLGREGQVLVMDFGLARTVDGAGNKAPDADLAAIRDAPRKSASLIATSTPFLSGSVGANGGVDGRVLAASSAASQSIRLPGLSLPVAVSSVESGPWREDHVATRDLSTLIVANGSAAIVTGGPSPMGQSPLTEDGALMGTPAYMAPEQFQGQVSDARSDQFSFCAALYEGLYGQRPFEGKNIPTLTANVIAGRVREAPADARVPRWLRKVVLRGLRVDRSQRYPSMEELLAELARNPARTRQRGMFATAVVALIAVLGVGLFRAERQQRTRCRGADAKLADIWELPNAKGLSARKQAIRSAFMSTGKRYAADSFAVVMKALDRYVVDWNTMHREACEATSVRGEQSAEVLDLRMSCLQDRFSEVRALTAVFVEANGDVVTKSVEAVQGIRPVEQCADIASLKAVVRPPDNPIARRAVAEVRNQLADVKALTSAGSYKKALTLAQSVLAAAKKTGYQPAIAEATLKFAEVESSSGDFAASAKDYEAAVWMAEAAHHDEVVVEATAQLVWVAGAFQRRFEDGQRWARHTHAVLARLGAGHELIGGWLANNVATMYEREGRFEDALKSAVEAVALKKKALGEEHLDVAISEDNVALALFRLGRIPEAIATNALAVRMIRRTLGPDHPEMAIRLVNGAEILNAAGRYSEARAMAEQAKTIWERDLGQEQALMAYALTQIGRSLLGEEQPAAAIPVLQQALQIRETRDPQPDVLGETRFSLARALWMDGHASERAVQLAKMARDDFQGNAAAKKQLEEVDRWLDARDTHVSMR
jgi:serine/threonine protein kinase